MTAESVNYKKIGGPRPPLQEEEHKMGEDRASVAKDTPSARSVVLAIAAADLVFHLLIANRYGIFRDEPYSLACSEHLDAGYVDQPPLIALVVWIARHVFGESLLGLRLIPAVAGAATVWLTGKLARDLGGGAFAQALARS